MSIPPPPGPQPSTPRESALPTGEVTDLPSGPLPGAGKGRLMTVHGTVTAGEESGCLLITTPDGVFNLVGAKRGTLRPGMNVEITGAPDDNLSTTCQQGRPFFVRTAAVLE